MHALDGVGPFSTFFCAADDNGAVKMASGSNAPGMEGQGAWAEARKSRRDHWVMIISTISGEALRQVTEMLRSPGEHLLEAFSECWLWSGTKLVWRVVKCGSNHDRVSQSRTDGITTRQRRYGDLPRIIGSFLGSREHSLPDALVRNTENGLISSSEECPGEHRF